MRASANPVPHPTVAAGVRCLVVETARGRGETWLGRLDGPELVAEVLRDVLVLAQVHQTGLGLHRRTFLGSGGGGGRDRGEGGGVHPACKQNFMKFKRSKYLDYT